MAAIELSIEDVVTTDGGRVSAVCEFETLKFETIEPNFELEVCRLRATILGLMRSAI